MQSLAFLKACPVPLATTLTLISDDSVNLGIKKLSKPESLLDDVDCRIIESEKEYNGHIIEKDIIKYDMKDFINE